PCGQIQLRKQNHTIFRDFPWPSAAASCTIWKTSSPELPTSSPPMWTSPSRTARKQCTPAAVVNGPSSFDVLRLFAEFLNIRFDFECEAGDRQALGLYAGSLGEQRIGLPLHFL